VPNHYFPNFPVSPLSRAKKAKHPLSSLLAGGRGVGRGAGREGFDVSSLSLELKFWLKAKTR